MTLPTCHPEQRPPVGSVGCSRLPSTRQPAIRSLPRPVSVTRQSSVFIDSTDILVTELGFPFPVFQMWTVHILRSTVWARALDVLRASWPGLLLGSHSSNCL